MSQLPFNAGILPEGGDGPTKRVLESDESRRESKQSKVQSYSEEHQATEVLEEREPKQIKTGLQSSPTFAGNIRYVADYGGVDVYVEPDEDSFEFPHEECFLHLEDEFGAGYNDDYDECSFSEQQENDGPPKLTDEELAQLDHDASLEELVRLSNMGVISEYGNKTGEEMVPDTRLVFDWRFRDEQWKRIRARLVAREFRSGDASNEETFAPTSSKWIIHMFLVLALVQQLNVLVMDVKDAFLTVPQRDLTVPHTLGEVK